MKKFTKLMGLIMMLMLMSAIVVAQAQQLNSNPVKCQTANSSINVVGEPGDSFDPNFNPYASQILQKGIGETDGLTKWALPSTGSTSGNSRIPRNTTVRYQMEEYLITAAEMAASGFPTNTAIDAIGFYIATAGVGTQTGDLKIYLMNTNDVSYTLGTNWNIAGFTMVSSDANFTVPIAAGTYSIPFVNGTPFTYTGGAVYVAWEFSNPLGTLGTTTLVAYCNTTQASMCYGYQNTIPGTTLTLTAFRPATTFTTNAYNDIVDLAQIYALEKYPSPYGTGTPTGVWVANVSASPVTFDVTLVVKDAATNTLIRYTNTVIGINLAAGTSTTVNFPWTQTQLENVNVTASTSVIAGETWTINNTKTIQANVNTNLFSTCFSNVSASGYGYTYQPPTYLGEGIFAVKYNMTGTGMIFGANVVISTDVACTGHTIRAVFLNSAGTIVTQSDDYVILAGDLGFLKSFTFQAPQLLTNQEFYVGLAQTQIGTPGQYYPLGIIAESPIRSGSYYNVALAGGTPGASVATWKYMVEARVTAFAPYNLGVANISAASSQLTWTSTTGLSDVEFGPAGFPPTGTPTHPNVTSLLTVATAPNTSYSFYARDISPGPIYGDWVGPYTFSTFCEDCPVGATAEGEAQLPNGSDGSGLNGGCAVSLPFLTSPIALGQTYCGQSNTFINNVGAASRDNDYYYLDLNSPACINWHLTITLKGNGLYNVTLFDAGNMTCAIGAVVAVTSTSACQTITIDTDVPSGNYYVVARVAAAAGNLWPVGSGPWLYVLTVNGNQIGAPNLDPDPPASFTKEVLPGGSAADAISFSNIGNLPLEWSASCAGNNQVEIFDNFESYSVGQLACQVLDTLNWGTWSNAPCSGEDGYIVNTQAFSPTKSLKIVLNNDQIKYLNHLTSGRHSFSFMQKIPNGKAGYFNLLSKFIYNAPDPQTDNYWAVEIYFNVDKSFTVHAEGVPAITATWTSDVWKKVEIIADLDNDAGYFYYDNNLIASWTWTMGSSFGTQGVGPLALDASDIFGATAADEMYIDDFKLELIQPGWLTLNGGVVASGTINPGDPPATINVAFNSTGWPAGTYTNTIDISTNEVCTSLYSIPVTFYVGYRLSGTVYYGIGNTKPFWTNTTVTLTPVTPPGAPITVSPASGGTYDIPGLANGTYTLTGATTKAWVSDIPTFDATLILRYVALTFFPTNLQLRAADVNMSNALPPNGVNTFDATLILRRAANVATPQWIAPNFVFDGPYPSTPPLIGLPVTVSGANVVQDLRTLCSGDVNGSATFVPPSK